VNRIHFAFPVANHDCLLEQMKTLQRLSSNHPEAHTSLADLADRIWLIRPKEKEFLDKSSIGPYTRTWFHMVNNSFECEPFEKAPKSLSLARSKEHKRAFERAGIPLAHQIESGPELERQFDGSSILRSSVVSKSFIEEILGGDSRQTESLQHIGNIAGG